MMRVDACAHRGLAGQFYRFNAATGLRLFQAGRFHINRFRAKAASYLSTKLLSYAPSMVIVPKAPQTPIVPHCDRGVAINSKGTV